MRRRDFIKAVAGSAATWPSGVLAQQPTMPVIGFIHALSPEKVPHFVAALHQGLGEVGFVEGKNIAVEYRWAYDQYDRLPELAAELVNRKGCCDRCSWRLAFAPDR
jgi:putative ABC transport system substrate-binding protein